MMPFTVTYRHVPSRRFQLCATTCRVCARARARAIDNPNRRDGTRRCATVTRHNASKTVVTGVLPKLEAAL